jgi:ribonuclease P protein component
MLPQSERLSRPRISELLKKGRRHTDALFDVRYLPAPSFQATIIISKKVAPLSVRRHLLKRRMSAALRAQKSHLGKTHIACVLKKSINPPSKDEYERALSDFIRKALSKSV